MGRVRGEAGTVVEASVVLYRVDQRDFEDIDESNDVVTEWMESCVGGG